jgi:hypothetical protein
VVDPRVPVTLVLALLGPQVLPWLARARNVQHGRQIPVHLGDLRARVRDARRAGGPAADARG